LAGSPWDCIIPYLSPGEFFSHDLLIAVCHPPGA